MPNRLIRDGILDSKRINVLSEGAELFYRKLMSIVDDFGRYEADPELLIAKLYAFRRERTASDIAGFLDECSAGEHPLLLIYNSGRKTYLELQDFNQRLRAKESRYPAPDGHMTDICQHHAVTCQSSAARARSSPSPTPQTPPPLTDRVVEMRKPPRAETLPDAQPVAAVANGTATPTSPHPGTGPRSPDPSRELWVNAHWLMHPKKSEKRDALEELGLAYDDPVKRRLVDANHPPWCATSDWTKENARYCPKLGSWVRDDGYVSSPPSESPPAPERRGISVKEIYA